MDFDDYQRAACRTAAPGQTLNQDLAMTAMGLSGESSELFELFLAQQETFLAAARVSVRAGTMVDGLKKNVFHAHPLDKEKLKKELGDLLWYVAVLAERNGMPLSEVASANIEKLKKRYPEGFDSTRSQSRTEEESPPPANRENRSTTSGVTPGFETASAPGPIDPETGQHASYWVLSKEERSKGFVRPLRTSYRHSKCGVFTSMGPALSETYARDPSFYSHTFCSHCRDHFPVSEFFWSGTNEVVGS